MAKMFLGAGFAPISSSSSGYGQAIEDDSYVPPMFSANFIDGEAKDFVVVDGNFVQVPEVADLVYMRLATSVDSSINFPLGNTLEEVKVYGGNARTILTNKVRAALSDIENLITIENIEVSLVNGVANIVVDYVDNKSSILGRVTR